MRHLSTEELLLYAEGELEDGELCRHVPDCVGCKAQMVDLQETYVYAASDLLARTRPQPARHAHLQQLRARLAAEAELLSSHLFIEDLLLSIEGGLDSESEAHLEACAGCRDRAADIHVQLAEIEYDLNRQTAYEVPAERRAAALAALRIRLQSEVKRQRARAAWSWDWRSVLRLPRVPAFASYATAFAAASMVAWIGWLGIESPVPLPEPQRVELAAPESQPVVGAEPATETRSTEARIPERFELPSGTAGRTARSVPVTTLDPASPELDLGAVPAAAVPIELPSPVQLPPPSPDPRPLAAGGVPISLPVPGRMAPSRPESHESAFAGSLMLVKTGLWKESLHPGGTDGRILFTGSAASESDRLRIERQLRSAADGWPVDFDISVRDGRGGVPAASGRVVALQERVISGRVRNSLLQHIDDSARRQFQPLNLASRENELNRYVTEVLRDETELLARAHALHSVLNRAGINAARGSSNLRRVVRSHLDAIDRHEDGVHGQLSEALEADYWRHRNHKLPSQRPDSLVAISRDLLQDALALDHALAGMFFGPGEALDARERNLSVETLLSRIRHHSRNLRDAIK